MSSSRRLSLSPAAGSGGRSARKRSREPETVEEAWRVHFKHSLAGSRRAACKYVAWPESMPPTLRDFAIGGRYHKVDPPIRPMTEAFRRNWEWERAQKAAWEARYAPAWEAGEGSSSGGGAPPTGDDEEEEEEEEGEDPLFLEAVAASKKDAADKAEAEREEVAHAIALVEEMKAREAARNYGGVVILDD